MPDEIYDSSRLTVADKNALIADPVNRGLSAREVIARLGPRITGCVTTVRRVRQAAGLDGRGYPVHSSHFLAEDPPPLREVAEDRSLDRMMRNVSSLTVSSVKATTGGQPSRSTRAKPAARWPEGKHVYFIQAGDDGPVKIGCTQNLKERYAELANGSPLPLTVIGVIPGYRPTEQHLHKLFAADRLHGEWFRPTAALLALASGRMFLGSNGRLKRRGGQSGDS